jgi:dTDP-4-amino-4,6-dideoxygalactose transaminase
MKNIKPFYLDLTFIEKLKVALKSFKILNSGNLILGKYTEAFESNFAKYIGSKYAVSMNTATSCLEVLMHIHNAKGKKIAVPSNTNFASVVAIIKAGGTPVFMDLNPKSMCSDLDSVEFVHKKYKIDGIMWVHIAGLITDDFDKICEFCKRNNIFLVEDCAHAHGSKFKGVMAGNFADGGAFSFFPTKVMTTMEGGMITTNNKNHAELAKSFRNQGKRHAAYGGLHYDMGNSWRINEISAYLGIIQLNKLNKMISKRTQAAREIVEVLKFKNIEYCSFDHMDQVSNYKFIILLKSKDEVSKIKAELSHNGIYCGGSVYDVPCHQQPIFKDLKFEIKDLSQTEKYCSRQLCLPITSGLSKSDINYMVKIVNKII